MKRILKFSLSVTLTLLFINCSSDDNNSTQETIPVTIIGDWSGAFSGGDNGTWNINVSSTGEVTGTGISNTFSDNYTFNGNVTSNGSITATTGTADTGATFIGVLNTNGTASGTWDNQSEGLSGNWQGNRD